jgi:predicted MarR family transcription regulator
MSRRGKKQFKTTECQHGPEINLPVEKLNPHERAVIRTLADASGGRRRPKKIVDIMHDNDWDKIGLAKGNSRVRNALRRLVRGKLVEHPEKIGDGFYRLTPTGKRKAKKLIEEGA